MHATEERRVVDDIPLRFDARVFRSEVRLDATPELEGELERYLERALSIVQPRALVCVAWVGERDGNRVEIGGRWFESEVLAENLADIHRVFAYVATCGPEIYELDISDLDPFASFWHDTLKTRAVRTAANYLCQFVKTTYGIERMSSMNPGSGDVDVWPIDQQAPLFDVLGDVEGSIGVRLTESCLMVPDKSVSGVFFPSETAYINCQSCTRAICPDRRAPYRPRS
ncbi:MAG: vitamin B12 dependent-methionine synthase activation domain-containing protein [Spirochaetota bacterium]